MVMPRRRQAAAVLCLHWEAVGVCWWALAEEFNRFMKMLGFLCSWRWTADKAMDLGANSLTSFRKHALIWRVVLHPSHDS